MKLALFAALMLSLAACGDDAYDKTPGNTDDTAAKESSDGGVTPKTTPPKATSPKATPMKTPTKTAPTTPKLTARETPIAAGETAPAFEGLPEGKTVVVFYRGHW